MIDGLVRTRSAFHRLLLVEGEVVAMSINMKATTTTTTTMSNRGTARTTRALQEEATVVLDQEEAEAAVASWNDLLIIMELRRSVAMLHNRKTHWVPPKCTNSRHIGPTTVVNTSQIHYGHVSIKETLLLLKCPN
jgi:hypothetical protein